MSRVVGGACLLEGREEKLVLRKMIAEAAAFGGIEVLTYVVMDNHFHVFVRVPRKTPLDDAEILRRYQFLYGERRSEWMPSPAQLEAVLRRDDLLAARWRARLLARMGDLSAFMKTVKQRFARWYNRTHDRFGAFWAERYLSVLVEDSLRALTTVAAYIDLNPVRAGLVQDPAAFEFSGFAEATRGVPSAQHGLRSLYGARALPSWTKTAARYRLVLRVKPGVVAGAGSRPERAATAHHGESEGAESGRPQGTLPELSRGVVLGSPEFVRRWHEDGIGGGPARVPRAPVELSGIGAEGLSALRRAPGKRSPPGG